ncbi:MAG: L-threonylcarbamoyladenylate synthase [Planctomycetota bacterium]|jgi:tRNA threonylcarbamoyl adenosine modification protein (Sua5/YciO/YrdC/YwlC family)
MQTKIIKLDATKPDKAKIKEAAALIDAGGLVAFPTETVYGIACRVQTQSLTKLNNLKGRTPDKHYTLHIDRRDEVKKYVPAMGLRVEKLINKTWPGPLTIVFELSNEDMDKQQSRLDKAVFEYLYTNDNTIGIRCPDNPIASLLLESTKSPVVAPSANITGQEPSVDPQQVITQFSGQIELLLDGGPCRHKKSSTVVKIGNKGLKILRKGVYTEKYLQEISQVKFLFVCTGNTCRSPIAEGTFRKYLAKKLDCEVDHLDKMGYKTFSAGILETSGSPATREAIAACAAKGIDIKAHKSRTLSQELVEESDFIFAMAQMHREQIIALSSAASEKCVLLAENKDIPDPIGQPQQVYNNCAEMIEKAIIKRIGEIVL